MHNKVKPTREEERRFDAMQDRGCVPCWLEAKLQGRKWAAEPGDIHHVVQADQCGHHSFTYLCCPWHHRGVPKNDLNDKQMRAAFGPSMVKEPAAYRARYGSEDDLLVYQERLLIQSLCDLGRQ